MQEDVEVMAGAIRRLEVAAAQGRARVERAREFASPDDPLLAIYEEELKRLDEELVRLRAEHARSVDAWSRG